MNCPLRDRGSRIHRRLVFATSMLMALMMIGCTKPPRQNEKASMVAIPDKEAYLLSLLNRTYENPDVHCELGRLYTEESMWDKAHHHFNAALGFDAAHRQSQGGLISMYVKMGKKNEADRFFQRFMQQLMNTPVEMTRLGNALAEEHLDPYALQCYEQALVEGSNIASVRKYVGFYYLRRNQPDRAIPHLKKSFELNPDQSDVAGALGRLGIRITVPEAPEPDKKPDSPKTVE